MTGLFPELEPQHNPGGKTMRRLPAGVVGDAEFYGDHDEYRLWLSRFWGDPRGPYAVSIGMNPSTANHLFNDPTLDRDTHFCLREQVSGFYKLNAMDYRVTDQRGLLKPGVIPRSDRNLPTIKRICSGAATVILSSGAVHKKLQHYVDDVVNLLEWHEIPIWCLGYTNGGHAAHSLYKANDTPLQPFRRK